MAIRQHAKTCRIEPDNAAAVVRAGEALCAAVLEYEAVLAATSGWSNPLRQLGPLPVFHEEQPEPPPNAAAASNGETGTRIEVSARYGLVADSEGDLVAFVRGDSERKT
jgi:hypothetical protein